MKFPKFLTTVQTGWRIGNELVAAHSLLVWLGFSASSASVAALAAWTWVAGLPGPVAILVVLATFAIVFFSVIWVVGFCANFDELGWGMVALPVAAGIVYSGAPNSLMVGSAKGMGQNVSFSSSVMNTMAALMVRDIPIYGRIESLPTLEPVDNGTRANGVVTENGNRITNHSDLRLIEFRDLHVKKSDLRKLIRDLKNEG